MPYTNTVTGYSSPHFDIYYDDYTLLDSIDLKLCDSTGLTEDYEFISIEHNLIDYSTIQTYLGYYITFTLSYAEWSDAENSLKIKNLINYSLNNYRIFIQPRIDLARSFEVNMLRDGFSLGIMKNGIKAIGNTGIVLKYKTKYKLTELDWQQTYYEGQKQVVAMVDFCPI